MRAVLIDRYGGPDVVRIGEILRPEVTTGHVLVRVLAAGVNPVDWKLREGYMKAYYDRPVSPLVTPKEGFEDYRSVYESTPFPRILGAEIAGVIDAVGAGVDGFAVGDEVYGQTGIAGGFADFVLMTPDNLAKKPAALGMHNAAAVPVAAITAETALDAGKVERGTRLLVHAAAGSVGSFAVQLACHRSADVTALGSSQNLEFLRDLGATHVCDRNSAYEEILGEFDVVLDAFGRQAQARSWKLLRKGGTLVSVATVPDGETAEAYGVTAMMVVAGPNAAPLRRLAPLLEQGAIKINVSRTYPVEDAVAAIAEVAGGRVRGKVVLTFN